jgi:integral membrane sensor domain MASE1
MVLLIICAVLLVLALFHDFMKTKVKNEKIVKAYTCFVTFLEISWGILIIGAFVSSAFLNYSEEIFAFLSEHKKEILCVGVVLLVAYLDR